MTKTITVTNCLTWERPKVRLSELKDMKFYGPEEMDASDGYHTFTELYRHRNVLFIAFLKTYWTAFAAADVWRSKLHSDGTSFEGWFIAGLDKRAGQQITYHLPMREWDELSFCLTLERAPEWDGHTPVNVLARLRDITLHL